MISPSVLSAVKMDLSEAEEMERRGEYASAINIYESIASRMPQHGLGVVSKLRKLRLQENIEVRKRREAYFRGCAGDAPKRTCSTTIQNDKKGTLFDLFGFTGVELLLALAVIPVVCCVAFIDPRNPDWAIISFVAAVAIAVPTIFTLYAIFSTNRAHKRRVLEHFQGWFSVYPQCVK